MSLPSTILVNGYNETEKGFMAQEFNSLKNARQEEYSKATIREWVKLFWDNGYSANQVCRMIRAVKEMKIYSKVTWADFVNAELQDIPDIVPQEIKDEFLYAIFECSVCHKTTTIQKKDLYVFKVLKICEHKILDEFNLKNYYGQLKENYQVFDI